jgi:hypothetical protein
MKMKSEKRKEAEARNAEWAALSPQKQLAHLDKLGLVAKKQRAKIAKKIEAAKEAK